MQIYFRLCECKIYQNKLRFVRAIDKSFLPRFYMPHSAYILLYYRYAGTVRYLLTVQRGNHSLASFNLRPNYDLTNVINTLITFGTGPLATGGNIGVNGSRFTGLLFTLWEQRTARSGVDPSPIVAVYPQF